MPDVLRSEEILVAPPMVWTYDGWARFLNHEAVTEVGREKSLIFTTESGSTLYRVYFVLTL